MVGKKKVVDLKDIKSVGPDDGLDGTKHLFGNICTINRIFHMYGLQDEDLGGR